MNEARQVVTLGQLEAEATMEDTGRIDRVLDVGSDDAGRPVPRLATPPIYEGMVKVRSYRPHEQERDVAGATVTTQRYDLQIPAPERMEPLLEEERITTWNGPVKVGDFLTITTPGSPARVYRIAGEHDLTYQTAQRLLAEQQTGGISL